MSLRLALLLLPLLFAGCNSYTTLPVKGIAKLKGGGDVSKLAGHTVNFEATKPGPDGKTPSAIGEIGQDGTFLLSTNGTNDGCYPGTFKIAITPPLPPVDAPKPPLVIDPKYSNLQTSGLEQTIDAKTKEVVLELDPAP